MKYALLLIILIGQASLAQTDQPFPNHEQPPEGWFCSPKASELDHKCACKRMDQDRMCEGTPTEDTQCKVWCHKDHCRCPVVCKTSN